MGLFDFIKNAGKNIFGGGDEATQIQEMISTELGDKVKNLKVEFSEGVVKLYGSCDSAEVKEKAILLAGNLKGVSKVDDTNLSAPAPVELFQFYTIQKGDTLSKIARKYYGDPMKYPVLFEANREVIKNPDLIYPGQVVRVPKLK